MNDRPQFLGTANTTQERAICSNPGEMEIALVGSSERYGDRIQSRSDLSRNRRQAADGLARNRTLREC
jgi:hypothetical protein